MKISSTKDAHIQKSFVHFSMSVFCTVTLPHEIYCTYLHFNFHHTHIIIINTQFDTSLIYKPTKIAMNTIKLDRLVNHFLALHSEYKMLDTHMLDA